MRRTTLIVLITILTKIASGQTASTLMGARTMALGYSSATLSDAWSAQNNPAGLGWLKGSWVAATNNHRLSAPGANSMAATVGVSGKLGGLAVSGFKFGDDVYSEQTISIAYGHQLGIASLGARADLIQYRTEGYQPVVASGITIGSRARITAQLTVAGYVSNINRPHFPDGRAIPMRMAAGFAWQPGEHAMICAELEKVAELEPILKTGFELTPIRKVKVRTGFNIFPYSVYGGFGFRAWKISIDYALSFSYLLSYSHQLSIEISAFKDK